MTESDFEKAITQQFFKALDSVETEQSDREQLDRLLDQAIREGMSTREACEVFNNTFDDITSLANTLRV